MTQCGIDFDQIEAFDFAIKPDFYSSRSRRGIGLLLASGAVGRGADGLMAVSRARKK